MPALSRNCILGFFFDRLRMSGRRGTPGEPGRLPVAQIQPSRKGMGQATERETPAGLGGGLVFPGSLPSDEFREVTYEGQVG